MKDTHEYDTVILRAANVGSTHVLVGESGGLSAVYGNSRSSGLVLGLLTIETEHGTLFVDPDKELEVLA